MSDIPRIWYSPSELDWFGILRHSRHYLSLSSPTVRPTLPADARPLYPAVIDEAALARAADEVHSQFCSCDDVSHEDEYDNGYDADARLFIEAYLRALGGGER